MRSVIPPQLGYFRNALIISVTGHAALFGLSTLAPQPIEVSVIEAPSSIEAVLVEETIPEPEIIEDIPEIEETPVEPEPEPVLEPVEEIVEEIPEPIVEEPIEEIIAADNPEPEAPIIEIPQEIEELVEQKTEIVEPQPRYEESIASQGALTEAVPLDYVNPAPRYPRIAKKRGWEGEVLLQVSVNTQGQPTSITILKSSGYSLLDREAVSTVETWQFTPARSGNVNFASTITIPVQFKLLDH